jgi:arylsulfatase A-like enzyme
MNVAKHFLKNPVDPDSQIALYKGEISYLDNQIGRLIKELEKMGVYQNTMIILVADHGESMTEKEIYFCHAGLYNPVCHVPLIMSLPERLPEGHKVQSLTSSVDIYPTVLDLLGLELPENLDGKSLKPTFKDPNHNTHPYIFCEAVGGIIRAVYEDEYKYIKPYPWDWAVTEEHLYRAFEDYKEKNDLMDSEAERAEKMEQLMDTWLELASEGKLDSEVVEDIDDQTMEALKALGYIQ